MSPKQSTPKTKSTTYRYMGYWIYKPWGGKGYKAFGFPGSYKSLAAIRRAIRKEKVVPKKIRKAPRKK